jgi:hypothetical protein
VAGETKKNFSSPNVIFVAAVRRAVYARNEPLFVHPSNENIFSYASEKKIIFFSMKQEKIISFGTGATNTIEIS